MPAGSPRRRSNRRKARPRSTGADLLEVSCYVKWKDYWSSGVQRERILGCFEAHTTQTAVRAKKKPITVQITIFATSLRFAPESDCESSFISYPEKILHIAEATMRAIGPIRAADVLRFRATIRRFGAVLSQKKTPHMLAGDGAVNGYGRRLSERGPLRLPATARSATARRTSDHP